MFTPSVQVDSTLPLADHNDPSITATGPVDSSSLSGGQQLAQSLEIRSQQSPVPIVGTLNAAQTQYLNQLTQQTSENMKTQYGSSSVQGYATGQGQMYDKGSTPVYSSSASNVPQYNSNTQQYGNPQSGTFVNSFAVNSSYGGAQEQPPTHQQPVRTKTQRARVPPPSKVLLTLFKQL